MKFRHLLATGVLLLGLSSIVYGQLTSSDFLLQRHFPESAIWEIAVWAVLIFLSYGTAVYFLAAANGSAPVYGPLVLSSVICLLSIGISALLMGEYGGWGKVLRFDVAPIAFYTMLGFSIFGVTAKESPRATAANNVAPLLIMASGSLILGVGIFLAKSVIGLKGGYAIGMQYLLSFLCVVLPMVSVLAAVRLKILERKGKP